VTIHDGDEPMTATMTVTTVQILTTVGVLAGLLWVAMRPGKPRGARRPSSGDSWSADANYNLGDAGQHHGSGGHHSGSDHSGDSGSGGSDGSGSDGGGGGDGGGSSD
jgi:hypothetical protein